MELVFLLVLVVLMAGALASGYPVAFALPGSAIVAVLLLVSWSFVWRGRLHPAYYDAVAWHAHEMLFGYTTAVIAGFLLTAVRNWSGVQTWTGARLAGLAAVWLAARILPWIDGVSAVVVVVVDTAFLPLLAASLVLLLALNAILLRLAWRSMLRNWSRELRVMALLGASPARIRAPLQLTAVIQGLLPALLAWALCVCQIALAARWNLQLTSPVPLVFLLPPAALLLPLLEWRSLEQHVRRAYDRD